jgi:hypothetical protein
MAPRARLDPDFGSNAWNGQDVPATCVDLSEADAAFYLLAATVLQPTPLAGRDQDARRCACHAVGLPAGLSPSAFRSAAALPSSQRDKLTVILSRRSFAEGDHEPFIHAPVGPFFQHEIATG